jgi:tagatose 1,6-diphosphate aldolase GatY/KbaY
LCGTAAARIGRPSLRKQPAGDAKPPSLSAEALIGVTRSRPKAPRSLVNLEPLLAPAQRFGYAVPGLICCNAETAQAVVEQGTALRSPVLLMAGSWEIPLLGAQMLVEIAAWLASRCDVPVCLHLDHAAEQDLVQECLEAGFPSVMMDASQHDFAENIRRTRAAVEMARGFGATVEGELGAVGRVGDSAVEGAGGASLTDPALVAEFVERTGVDALAVAIGNAHGFYAQRPDLDFERLEAIRAATGIPLVLHGGSGTPPEMLRRAVEIGISKVNVASELSQAHLAALGQAVAPEAGWIWFAEAQARAKAAVAQVAARWMRLLGCAGRASRRLA